MQIVALHKDRCFSATEQTLICSIIISEATHRWTEEGRAFFFHRQVFLQAQTPDGDLHVSTDVINNMLPVFRCAYHSKDTRGAGKAFKRPAQRKPAKGNGAPQSAYPVSAAFSRM